MSLLNKIKNKVNYVINRKKQYPDYLEFVSLGKNIDKLILNYIRQNQIQAILFLECNELTGCIGNYFEENGCMVGFAKIKKSIFIGYDYKQVESYEQEQYDVIVGANTTEEVILFRDFCKAIEKQGVLVMLEDSFLAIHEKGGFVINVYIPTQQEMPKANLNADRVTRHEYSKMQAEESYEEFISNRIDINKRNPAVFRGGVAEYLDYHSETVNFISGERFNPFKTGMADHDIYIIGPCISAGLFSSDDKTIGSKLQQLCSKSYNVVSYGVGEVPNLFHVNRLDSLEIKQDDIVIYISDVYEQMNNCYTVNLKNAFSENLVNRGYFYFDAPIHCNSLGYDIISHEVFKIIENKSFKNYSLVERSIASEGRKTINEDKCHRVVEEVRDCYLKYVDQNESDKIVGAIVMNCNPMTNGHVFLIEEALKRVDLLYVFVVQENRSTFSFEDRYDCELPE